MQATGSLLSIAEHDTQSGRVSYPVLPTGEPYVAQFLKVDHLHQPKDQWNRIVGKGKFGKIMAKTPICQRVPSFCSQPARCRKWCAILSVWKTRHRFRPDINERLEEANPKHLATQVIFHALDVRQSDFFWYLLRMKSEATISELDTQRGFVRSLTDIANVTIAKENEVDWLLTELSNSPETAKNFQFHMFGYAPYMYTDPVVPGGFTKNNLPMLRVGDSLASGDPNVANGLDFHIQVIQHLIKQLIAASDDQTSLPQDAGTQTT